jgi:HEAT repeat protein
MAVTAMGDADDDVRLAAAEAAIRFHAAGASDAAILWLNAPNARLRRAACAVTRALPTPRAIAPLARTLGDPDAEVRAAAAEALGRQGSADAVPPLLGRLDDPAPATRAAIVSSLARLGDARALIPLVGKIEDSAAEVRQGVARALGNLGDARASSALVLALRDQSPDVRREALSALGRLRAADAVDAIGPFSTDRLAPLRLAAVEALGRVATPQSLHVLVSSLGTGDDGAGGLERSPVRDALLMAQGSAVTPLRTVLAGSPTPAAATSAAWVLGELHAHAEAPRLVEAMRRGTLPTAAGLHALAGAGTAAEVPFVLEFVADASPIVRVEALRAAYALLEPSQPDGRAVEPLAEVFQDTRTSTAERAQIARVLGRTGAPRAASLLGQQVNASDALLRLAAIDALGHLGPGGADDALLSALESRDPEVRLHAAVALSESGGARSRDALLRGLEGGDEVDRPSLLTALGGVLSRAPTEEATRKLATAFELAGGPERDAIIEALGRAPLASAVDELARIARSGEPFDRQSVAILCAAHSRGVDPGGANEARAIAEGLLGDSDVRTRAQAVWSLGELGDASVLGRLQGMTHADEPDVAINAAAAMGRILARKRDPQAAAHWLCPLLASRRSLLRANAWAGLALSSARCSGGVEEREALVDDPDENVRAAAALVVRQGSASEDARALDQCARTDVSGLVATRCLEPETHAAATHPVLVFVVPEGAEAPRASAPYLLLLSDGLVRAGTSDRRGAVFDPRAPEGSLQLLSLAAERD